MFCYSDCWCCSILICGFGLSVGLGVWMHYGVCPISRFLAVLDFRRLVGLWRGDVMCESLQGRRSIFRIGGAKVRIFFFFFLRALRAKLQYKILRA